MAEKQTIAFSDRANLSDDLIVGELRHIAPIDNEDLSRVSVGLAEGKEGGGGLSPDRPR